MKKIKNSDYRSYGYNDSELTGKEIPWRLKHWISLALAICLIIGLWLALDQKLLFGKDWLSETYDNPDWHTNEGNLHTYGAWDLETHIWKTEYLMKNFPNYQWNPYWYLGMPLLKYYQSGFYMLHWLVISITHLTAAKSALLMIIFSHLIATFLTFLLCYKVSKRIWISALCSSFVIANTFISLRSYGWEPITVIFLFLYPLGMLLFLKEPLRPFRFWLILTLGISYISHPLLWFSLCMFMGVYLLLIAARHNTEKNALNNHYILQFIGVVILSLFIGGIQFVPQITYQQATSGAHMGVKYLPYYQVPFNIIPLKDFFFDAGNLKGPGPVVMIAFFLLIIFAYLQYFAHRKEKMKRLHSHELISGLAATLFLMVLFYYLELYDVFPMNLLRSIQYHRIIPEFVITAAVLVAALSQVAYTYRQKVMYYAMLVTFMLASGIIIYLIQTHWVTTDSISAKPEFITDKFEGRISFPYTDQSLSVRSSFTQIPQSYGYYEQGITNTFNDEIFSVSSGFHNADNTILYLKAANVARLYVNMEEGERDRIMRSRVNQSLHFVKVNNSRYSYFEIPLKDASFVQSVDVSKAAEVQKLKLGCRVIFQEKYCGSRGEEFVSTDSEEIKYITQYVGLLEEPYSPKASMQMENPNDYSIKVKGANVSTGVVMKMTYDKDFIATVNGKKVPIEDFGPDFMLISPNISGDYTISLEYRMGTSYIFGISLSIITILALSVYFSVHRFKKPFFIGFRPGDMT
ncbi:MAG TPA: hypothetical protein VI564_06465 [Candidatus Nanoarchaeia archaeon]|nr:hypothetical protein [Candidatus Nanoarchaeia archaeon]